MKLLILGLAGTLICANAMASEEIEDADGTLNPSSLTIDYWVRRLDEKPFDQKICIYGYPAAKMGDHVAARRIFEACSTAGVEMAMPWMSWTEENGYDKPSDPAKAAEWDRRLAEKGNALGALNYGLDLLRGHGVPQDLGEGRAYIDRAAAGGDVTAKDLAAHDYDPEVATPSADSDRYTKFGY